MSRGPGRIQRELLAIFERADHPAFDTGQLCRQIYPGQAIEKKHRVAVIRALKSLAQGPLQNLWKWTPEFEKADAVWFDHSRIPLKGLNRKPVHRP